MKHYIIRFIGICAIIVGIGAFGAAAVKDSGLGNQVALGLQNLKGTTLGTAPSPSQNAADLYAPTVQYEEAIVNATEKASKSVVSITISKNLQVYNNCGDPSYGTIPPELRDFFGFDAPTADCKPETVHKDVGGGSGFIVSGDGYIVTNKHVVSDESADYTVVTDSGKTYPARVLARDPVQDIAIVKIDATGLTPATLGDSNSVRLGQTAIAIGNSLGEFKNSVSVGVISGLSRNITASGEDIYGVFQTDAAINPGNSGGPLLNLKGDVIGMNTAIAANAENVGFAIPINDAKRDIDTVRTKGAIKAPFLGVHYVPVTQDLATQEKLSVTNGALVRSAGDGAAVVENSPAAKAGLKEGDIIISVDGENVTADMPLAVIVNHKSVGAVVSIVVHRGANTLTLRATLEERP